LSDKNGQPKCDHGVAASVVKDEETGERQRIGPADCGLCPTGKPIGIPFRLASDHRRAITIPKPPSPPVLVECPKPGCVIVIEKGVNHFAPCVVIQDDAPDSVYEVRWQDESGKKTWRQYPCPKCEAEAGELCRRLKQKAGLLPTLKKPHSERKVEHVVDDADKKD